MRASLPSPSRRLRPCSAASDIPGTLGVLCRRDTRPSGICAAMAGRCTCCIALDYTRVVEHVLRQVVKDFVEALGMPRGSDERLMQLCFQARLYLRFLAFSPSLVSLGLSCANSAGRCRKHNSDCSDERERFLPTRLWL